MKLKMATPSLNSEWVPPAELPDLTDAKTIAIDVETRDPNIKKNGPGWAVGDGEVVGYAVATADWAGISLQDTAAAVIWTRKSSTNG